MAGTKAELRAFVARAIKTHPHIGALTRALGAGSGLTGREVDKATTSLDLSPALYHLALSNRMLTRLGEGLHIPVAVSDREGGRRSLLNLDPGEESHTGSLVIGASVYHQYFKRLDGKEKLAKKSNYREKITTADGNPVYVQDYRLTQIDEKNNLVHLQAYADSFESAKRDVIVYHAGICYICIGSVWWCGLPCIPLPGRPGDTEPIEPLRP